MRVLLILLTAGLLLASTADDSSAQRGAWNTCGQGWTRPQFFDVSERGSWKRYSVYVQVENDVGYNVTLYSGDRTYAEVGRYSTDLTEFNAYRNNRIEMLLPEGWYGVAVECERNSRYRLYVDVHWPMALRPLD